MPSSLLDLERAVCVRAMHILVSQISLFSFGNTHCQGIAGNWCRIIVLVSAHSGVILMAGEQFMGPGHRSSGSILLFCLELH